MTAVSYGVKCSHVRTVGQLGERAGDLIKRSPEVHQTAKLTLEANLGRTASCSETQSAFIKNENGRIFSQGK